MPAPGIVAARSGDEGFYRRLGTTRIQTADAKSVAGAVEPPIRGVVVDVRQLLLLAGLDEDPQIFMALFEPVLYRAEIRAVELPLDLMVAPAGGSALPYLLALHRYLPTLHLTFLS